MTEFLFSPRQTDAYKTIDKDDIDVLLYGGAKGGGKSVFGVRWAFLYCWNVIKEFNLKPQKFPIPLGFMGRKQSVDFNDTTLETWKAFIPEEAYELRSGDKEIVIQGTVKIQYGGFDDKLTVKKFNSAEYAFGFIDQAEELTRDDYGLFRGTLRRKVHDKPLKYKVLLTANPAACWLKDEFITSLPNRAAFVQALPSDNPFLPPGYVDNLKEAFKHRPELLDAYLFGSWDVISGTNLVIKPSWVERAVNFELHMNPGRRLVACDPARYGDDETVIYVFEDEKIIHQDIYGQKSTMETAGRLVALKNQFNCKLIAVESVGIGAGICDRLHELREPILEINPGEKATTEEKQKIYQNRRAQMWWEAAERFGEGEVSVLEDLVLRRQLVNVQYQTKSNGKIQVESKEDIKERMNGQSPDRADCFILGLHALNYVKQEATDFHRRRPKPHRPNDYGWQIGPNPQLGNMYA